MFIDKEGNGHNMNDKNLIATFYDEKKTDGIWVAIKISVACGLEIHPFSAKIDAFNWISEDIGERYYVDEMCKDCWKDVCGEYEWQIRFINNPE